MLGVLDSCLQKHFDQNHFLSLAPTCNTEHHDTKCKNGCISVLSDTNATFEAECAKTNTLPPFFVVSLFFFVYEIFCVSSFLSLDVVAFLF